MRRGAVLFLWSIVHDAAHFILNAVRWSAGGISPVAPKNSMIRFDVFEYVSIHLLMSSRGRVSQDNGQTCMKYFMQNHAPRGNSLIDFHPTVFVHVWRRESEGGPNRETRTILNRLFFPYSFCTSRPRLSKWWNCRFSFVQFSFIEYTNTKNDFWNGNSIPTHDHTICTAR